MLTIGRVKNLLNDPTIADEEAEKIRDEFHALAEIIFENWQSKNTNKKKEILKISIIK